MNRKIVLLFVIFIWGIFIPSCTPEQNLPLRDQDQTSQPENHPTNKAVSTKSSNNSQTPTPIVEDMNLETASILLIGIEEEPFGYITQSIKSALEDAIRYANEHLDLDGIKVELRYTATENISKTILETFLEQTKKINPLIVLMAAPVDEELAKEINRIQVPTLYFGLGGNRLDSITNEEDYLFWLTPLPDEQFAFFLDQTWRHWEDLRPPGIFNEFRIGYLTWDELPSKFSITSRLDKFNKQKQFDFIFEGELVNSSQSSSTNFLLDCITYGITILYTDTFGYSPMVLLNDVYSLGLNNFFVIGGSVWSYDDRNSKFLLAPDDVAKFYVSLPVKWWSDEDDPSIILANQIFDEAGKSDREKNLAYLLALGAMDISIHVFQAVEHSNGKNDLSAEQIYSELVDLNGYSVLDGLFEVDFSGGNRSPKTLRLWLVTPDNQWTPIGTRVNVPKMVDDDN